MPPKSKKSKDEKVTFKHNLILIKYFCYRPPFLDQMIL